MFFFGVVDNCCTTFNCIALGFEFTSKIVPFGTKNFLENMTIFIILIVFTIWPFENKEMYRILFLLYLILGIFGGLSMYIISKKFKHKID